MLIRSFDNELGSRISKLIDEVVKKFIHTMTWIVCEMVQITPEWLFIITAFVLYLFRIYRLVIHGFFALWLCKMCAVFYDSVSYVYILFYTKRY